MQLEAVKWFLLLLLNLCNCLAYRYIDIYRLQQKSIPLIISGNICHITNKPPLSSIIKSRRLTFFGHLARMQMLAKNWRRPPGQPHTAWMKNIHDDLSLLDLGIPMRLEIWCKIGLSVD